MDISEWVEQHYAELKTKSSIAFIDIKKENWNLPFEIIDKSCREIYAEIIDVYENRNLISHYPVFQELFFAEGLLKNEELGFCAGVGFSECKSSSTHGIECEIALMLKKLKSNPQPINLTYLLVGHRKNEGSSENDIYPRIITRENISSLISAKI